MDRERFLDALCQFSRGWQLLFVVSVVSIGILLLSLGSVDPGTGTYVIVLVQLVSFAGVAAFTAVALALCVRR